MHISEFKNKVNNVKQYEKYYATLSKKLDKHEKKWSMKQTVVNCCCDDLNAFIEHYHPNM